MNDGVTDNNGKLKKLCKQKLFAFSYSGTGVCRSCRIRKVDMSRKHSFCSEIKSIEIIPDYTGPMSNECC